MKRFLLMLTVTAVMLPALTGCTFFNKLFGKEDSNNNSSNNSAKDPITEEVTPPVDNIPTDDNDASLSDNEDAAQAVSIDGAWLTSKDNGVMALWFSTEDGIGVVAMANSQGEHLTRLLSYSLEDGIITMSEDEIAFVFEIKQLSSSQLTLKSNDGSEEVFDRLPDKGDEHNEAALVGKWSYMLTADGAPNTKIELKLESDGIGALSLLSDDKSYSESINIQWKLKDGSLFITADNNTLEIKIITIQDNAMIVYIDSVLGILVK